VSGALVQRANAHDLTAKLHFMASDTTATPPHASRIKQ
jgi:hypothetical protein